MRYPNIEAERARAELTAAELGSALGISRKTYSNWQNGKSEIPASKLCSMADIFGCSTDYLLGRKTISS